MNIDIDELFAHTTPEPNSGCWIWLSMLNGRGYGRLKFQNKTILAHRASYSATHGPIPEGLFILHKCDNRSCINPDHLYAGTQAENIADMMKRQRHAGSNGKRCGERNPNARVPKAIIDRIRALLATGNYTQKEVAAMFGLRRSYVSTVHTRTIWK